MGLTTVFHREMRDIKNWIPLALLNVSYIKLAANLDPRSGKAISGTYPEITGRLELETVENVHRGRLERILWVSKEKFV